jgi:coenzyme Q-binding protein COQ10
MTTVERSIFVNAPPEVVTEISQDPYRLPEWYTGIERAEPDGVYPEVGGRVAVVYKAAGISFDITMTAVEHVPGQSQTNQMEGMITGTNYWWFEPEGEGTHVTARFEYQMPGGALGKVADKLVVERMNEENLEKSLQALKTLAEG